MDRLCRVFGISPFERDILLLCAGVELDARFGPLCAAAHDSPDFPYPTFALALAVFPEGDLSALAPTSVLRYWRMIDLEGRGPLADRRMTIDERVLMHLTGIDFLDEQLAGFVEPLDTGTTTRLPPSQAKLATQIVDAWSNPDSEKLPLVQLFGRDRGSRSSVVEAACRSLGLNVYSLPSSSIPTAPVEFERLRRLWDREAALSGCALLIDIQTTGSDDELRKQLVDRFCQGSTSPLMVSVDSRQSFTADDAIALEIERPTRHEQTDLWTGILANSGLQLNGVITRVVDHFDFDAATIAEIGTTLSRIVPGWKVEDLWTACVDQARPSFGPFAERIDVKASFDDLVLPDPQLETLQDIAVHVRHRHLVYDEWGFASKSSRGLGISALFSGPSGTGKTMAAEAIAQSLQLDLYRIDLSQVVSKYIGETEKNLNRVFEAAEDGGVVLLFDEADAIFGKRTEVKDSHDRYANIEISYLLQRMEAYRGLTILTTNMKSALDDAFKRRIRFMVSFPFPPAPSRRQIWERIFPTNTPTEGLDAVKLAQLNVTGGVIRNVAMRAAFLAADREEPVRMIHLLEAAKMEHAKIEKPLPPAEIKGWSD
jgi:hypothetical protein